MSTVAYTITSRKEKKKKGLADLDWQKNQTRLSCGIGSWLHHTSMLEKKKERKWKRRKCPFKSKVEVSDNRDAVTDVAAQRTLLKCQNKVEIQGLGELDRWEHRGWLKSVNTDISH